MGLLLLYGNRTPVSKKEDRRFRRRGVWVGVFLFVFFIAT